MRIAKWSIETWGKSLGRKLSVGGGGGEVLAGIWGYLENQGRGKGIPRAGVKLGAATASLGSGQTGNPKNLSFPTCKIEGLADIKDTL